MPLNSAVFIQAKSLYLFLDNYFLIYSIFFQLNTCIIYDLRIFPRVSETKLNNIQVVRFYPKKKTGYFPIEPVYFLFFFI